MSVTISMSVTIRPVHPVFAAEINGVDISAPLVRAEVAAIEAAINQFGILVFRGQALSDPQHIAFASNFGQPERTINAVRPGNRSTTISPLVSDITNLDDNGDVRGATDRRRMFALANRIWHADSSFRHVPAALSFFFAREIPPTGGETEFADMRAAYDALPEAWRAGVEDLLVVHDYTHARSQLGFTDFSPEELAAFPPVQQRLVRRHPGSRRKSLYIGGHASHIVGRPVPDGRMMLQDLTEFATNSRFVYTHEWTVGDLVIWDNRCTLHRGRYYDPACRRDFRRVTTSDLASTLDRAA